MNDFKQLEPGDIFAAKGAGILGWAVRNLIAPSTDRFHFGILWKQLPDGDFIILEAIMKGIAVGKLSWYDNRDVEFYRVNCPEDLRHAAPDGLIDWGRSRYDYLLIIKILFGGLLTLFKTLFKEKKIRRLKAEDFPYGRDSALICTEAVDVAYDSVGANVIPEGVIPIPNTFRQAEADGRMKLVGKQLPDDRAFEFSSPIVEDVA